MTEPKTVRTPDKWEIRLPSASYPPKGMKNEVHEEAR